MCVAGRTRQHRTGQRTACTQISIVTMVNRRPIVKPSAAPTRTHVWLHHLALGSQLHVSGTNTGKRRAGTLGLAEAQRSNMLNEPHLVASSPPVRVTACQQLNRIASSYTVASLLWPSMKAAWPVQGLQVQRGCASCELVYTGVLSANVGLPAAAEHLAADAVTSKMPRSIGTADIRTCVLGCRPHPARLLPAATHSTVASASAAAAAADSGVSANWHLS